MSVLLESSVWEKVAVLRGEAGLTAAITDGRGHDVKMRFSSTTLMC